MDNRVSKNDLRVHRRRSGLSQRQVGQVLGYPNEAQVSRHENAKTAPLLVSALGYEIIFRVPMRALFPGMYEEVRRAIERRLCELEATLQDLTVQGAQAEMIAQTLTWMMERRERDMFDGG